MNKEGKISQEQAAELIEALGNEEAPKQKKAKTSEQEEDLENFKMNDSKGKEYSFDLSNLGDFITKSIEGAVSGLVNKGNVSVRVKTGSNDRENKTVMSNIDSPEGEHYDFADNSFNLSNMSDIRLEHQGSFTDNGMHASTIRGIEINGSAIDDLRLESSDLCDTKINGSKFQSLELEDSSISDVKFMGTKFKNVKLHNSSSWSDISFNGVSVHETNFSGCDWSDQKFMGVKIANSTFEKVNFSDCVFKSCKIENSTIRNVDFSDRTFKELVIVDKDINSQQDFEALLR